MPLHSVRISHRFLEKFANHDGVLCRGSRHAASGLWRFTSAVNFMESDRADNTCTRFKYPCPYHHPPCRVCGSTTYCSTSKALPAGVLLVLDYMAIQDVADVHCSDRILGSRLHGLYFWLQMKAFLRRQRRFCWRQRTHSDACHARLYQADEGSCMTAARQWKRIISRHVQSDRCGADIIDSIVDIF